MRLIWQEVKHKKNNCTIDVSSERKRATPTQTITTEQQDGNINGRIAVTFTPFDSGNLGNAAKQKNKKTKSK